jgi:hypothetical protein
VRKIGSWIEACFALAAVLLITLAAIVMTVRAWGWNPEHVASWVQAVGSIAAIFGAAWIASEQNRRDVVRRKEEAEKSNYLLRAELAWLGGDILRILNKFANAEPGVVDLFAIHDDEVSDLLTRLTWCRQRVEHKGQLAMIGALRHSLVETVRIVETTGQRVVTAFRAPEIDALSELREQAVEAYNCALGVSHLPQYSA